MFFTYRSFLNWWLVLFVRAKDFIPQIYKKPFLGRSEYAEALLLIISGLLKKVMISDYISANFVDRVFDAPTLYTGSKSDGYLWLCSSDLL